jgi:hypothetical protein
MDVVIFTKDKHKKFEEYLESMFVAAQIDKKHGIFYDDIEIQQQINDWNERKCNICRITFPTMPLLENHLRLEHSRQFWFFFCLLM